MLDPNSGTLFIYVEHVSHSLTPHSLHSSPHTQVSRATKTAMEGTVSKSGAGTYKESIQGVATTIEKEATKLRDFISQLELDKDTEHGVSFLEVCVCCVV